MSLSRVDVGAPVVRWALAAVGLLGMVTTWALRDIAESSRAPLRFRVDSFGDSTLRYQPALHVTVTADGDWLWRVEMGGYSDAPCTYEAGQCHRARALECLSDLLTVRVRPIPTLVLHWPDGATATELSTTLEQLESLPAGLYVSTRPVGTDGPFAASRHGPLDPTGLPVEVCVPAPSGLHAHELAFDLALAHRGACTSSCAARLLRPEHAACVSACSFAAVVRPAVNY